MERAKDKVSEFGRRDLAFHRVIVEASGNQLYLAVMDGCFQSLGQRFAEKTYRRHAARIPEIISEHTAVLQAVQMRQPSAASAALKTHLQRSAQRLESLSNR